jgi:porin
VERLRLELLAKEFPKRILSVFAAALFVIPSLALGQTATSKPGADSQHHDVRDLHSGILPIRNFGGDLSSRAYLLGDWGGRRTELANKGIQFKGSLTPTLQSVTSGGLQSDTELGVSGDVWAALDFDRMGVIPGGLLVVRVEYDVGNSIVQSAGALMSPSYNAIIPVTSELDADTLTITNLYYTQFFGKKFGAWFGRTDNHHNANLGEFAGLNPNVGKTQFQNLAMTAIPVMPISQPYVTSLGGGVFAQPTRNLSFAAMVMDSRESSQRHGLDDFGRDWNAFFTARLQHNLGGLPGGQLLGYSYSWDGDYTKLENNQIKNVVAGTPLGSASDSWAIIYSGWQYVQVFDGDTSKPINLNDGRADHRGWGVFLMAGLADDDTNPIQGSLTVGVGGRGLLPGRPNDSFGIGYYILDVKSDVVADFIGLKSDEQGIEIFYEAEISPWLHVTPDLQIIDPGLSASDTAVILGLRVNVNF